MRTRTVFTERVCRREVRVRCPACKKLRTKVLKKSCYDNGFHHLETTLAKYGKELDAQVRKLQKSGLICAKCAASKESR